MDLSKIFLFCLFAQTWKVKTLRSLNANRNYLQEFIEILDVCRVPRTNLQIIEETGMSMRHLHFCLKYLLKQNMVKYHRRKRTYVTTNEGLRISKQLPYD